MHAHFANTTADCAALLARTLGVPFSFTAHAYDIYSTAPRVRNDTLAWKVRAAAAVIAISRYGAELLQALAAPDARHRIVTVHVGIPLELFAEAPWPDDAGPLRLLSVARWCEKKGLDTLLDACALLRDRGVAFELRLFGDGPLRAEVTARWTRLGLHGMDTSDPADPKIVHAFMPRGTAGARTVETWDVLGMRATRSDDTVLDGAFVPDRYVARVVPAGARGG